MSSSITFLSRDEFGILKQWVGGNKNNIPPPIYELLNRMIGIYETFSDIKTKVSATVARLREAMGIAPKTEKGKSLVSKAQNAEIRTPPEQNIEQISGFNKKDINKKIDQLKKQRKKLQDRINKYKDLIHKPRKKRKKTQRKDEIDGANNSCPEIALAMPDEKIFPITLNQLLENKERVSVDKLLNFENPKGLHTVSGERTRYETEIKITKISYEVETVTDPRTGKTVTASMDHIGPRKWQVTWKSVATIINCVVGYAIPINRLAKMLGASCKYFTSSRISEIILMSAKLLEPIYCQLGKELSNSDILSGDDTPTNVLEMVKLLDEGDPEKLCQPPKSSLVSRIANLFGRISFIKEGSRPQKQVNVSLVVGKTILLDPRSYIFFFHSHLGHLGNFLSHLLKMRSPDRKNLTIQGDLSASNRPLEEISKKLEIIWAGCMAHARRPFLRYCSDDPMLCYQMLRGFAILSKIEEHIDEIGRTFKTVERYRQRYSLKIWNILYIYAKSVVDDKWENKWPTGSHIYIACNYIVKNFDHLTRYIFDARLKLTNNMRERLLRWDKIMLDSSKFRKTEQGRAAIDILRTIVHTTAAAEINLMDYLMFVFANQKDLAKHPELYTPYAYALRQEENNK